MTAAVPEPNFSALIGLLTEQSLLAMGVPHPHLPQQPPANPEVARFFIGLLALLQEKTQGHLSLGEAQELEDMLYQLRMKALSLTPSSPR
jgi:hypothetical protein